MSTSRPRSRSNSQSRAEIISLDTLPTSRLFYKINTDVEELFRYATGAERMENIGVGQHLKDRIVRGSELIEERYNLSREELAHEIAEYKAEILRLNESLQGLKLEKAGLETDLAVTIIESEKYIRETENNFNEARNDLRNLLAETERLEGNHDILVRELQGNLEQAERRIAERDILLNNSNTQLERYRQERVYISALYRAEQILTRRLTREKRLLKMINRQRQIELDNVPVIAPQPINQIWLLL